MLCRWGTVTVRSSARAAENCGQNRRIVAVRTIDLHLRQVDRATEVGAGQIRISHVHAENVATSQLGGAEIRPD